MATLRQLFILFLFLAIASNFGESHKRKKRDGLSKAIKKMFRPELKYLRHRYRIHDPRWLYYLYANDNPGLSYDDRNYYNPYAPWYNFQSPLYHTGYESEDIFTNPIGYDDINQVFAKEDSFESHSNEKYDINEENNNNNVDGNNQNIDFREIINSKSNDDDNSKVTDIVAITPPDFDSRIKSNGKPDHDVSPGVAFNNKPFIIVFPDETKQEKLIIKENSNGSPISQPNLFNTFGESHSIYSINIAPASLLSSNQKPYISNSKDPYTSSGMFNSNNVKIVPVEYDQKNEYPLNSHRNEKLNLFLPSIAITNPNNGVTNSYTLIAIPSNEKMSVPTNIRNSKGQNVNPGHQTYAPVQVGEEKNFFTNYLQNNFKPNQDLSNINRAQAFLELFGKTNNDIDSQRIMSRNGGVAETEDENSSQSDDLVPYVNPVNYETVAENKDKEKNKEEKAV